MGVFDYSTGFLSLLPEGLRGSSLRTRLLLALVPSAILILMATGWATYRVSYEYISIALERITRVHNLSTAHAVEEFLDRCKRDLIYAARQPETPETMRRFLADNRDAGGTPYIEFGLIMLRNGEHIVFVTRRDEIVRLPGNAVADIRPSPTLLLENLRNLGRNEVWITRLEEVEYPFPTPESPNNRIAAKVWRMFTPYYGPGGDLQGYMYLALEGRQLRNLLSLYMSNKAPIFAFARNPELSRFSFFFDPEGWILFQSEAVTLPDAELATVQVRAGQQGTLGRPGMPSAFRPLAEETQHWTMVEAVAAHQQGIISVGGEPFSDTADSSFFLAYAPVRFSTAPGKEPMTFGGVAFLDRSKLTVLAGYRHLDVMFVIMLVATVAITLLIVLAARATTRSMLELADEVKRIQATGRLEDIRLRKVGGYEAGLIQEAINAMLATIRAQVEEIRAKDLAIESVALKEPAALDEAEAARFDRTDQMPEIIGQGRAMEQFKSEIAKAGQVDVDVLVAGETGTGKQLAAEAVHRLSRRANRPFISINCGELDENLLLDTLFGHVKGAFTEAKTDRKGAFLEAHGGTLFLDEIQSASARVQQALLRALSMRKIKPLGSDQEHDVDVRLITATNADLKALIEARTFREDLYYRLKVITVSAPPLRERPENIPILAAHFLREAELTTGRSGLALSRGALEKLKRHPWPGNVRELKNAITMAVVMAEGKTIQAEQLMLETTEAAASHRSPAPPSPAPALPASPARPAPPPAAPPATPPAAPPAAQAPELPADLNPRQLAAMGHALKHGGITRQDYEALLGHDVSKRTASYDIQDLVQRGLLTRVGRGPTTRYVLTKR
ncbi:MAG: sigma 54-interacting transcriptional regulator [Thermodesulfobacteriota bacterium]